MKREQLLAYLKQRGIDVSWVTAAVPDQAVSALYELAKQVEQLQGGADPARMMAEQQRRARQQADVNAAVQYTEAYCERRNAQIKAQQEHEARLLSGK